MLLICRLTHELLDLKQAWLLSQPTSPLLPSWMYQTPFKIQMTPWLPRKITSCPTSGCHLGASLFQSSSWMFFGKSLWKLLAAASFFCTCLLHGFWFSACLRQGWTSHHLHYQHNWLTASGDWETFSKIFFLGKTEKTKYFFLEIKKYLYFKAKLHCNKRMVLVSCKMYSHFWATVKRILRCKDKILTLCTILGYQVCLC